MLEDVVGGGSVVCWFEQGWVEAEEAVAPLFALAPMTALDLTFFVFLKAASDYIRVGSVGGMIIINFH